MFPESELPLLPPLVTTPPLCTCGKGCELSVAGLVLYYRNLLAPSRPCWRGSGRVGCCIANGRARHLSVKDRSDVYMGWTGLKGTETVQFFFFFFVFVSCLFS